MTSIIDIIMLSLCR